MDRTRDMVSGKMESKFSGSMKKKSGTLKMENETIECISKDLIINKLNKLKPIFKDHNLLTKK